jgi:ribonuclease M5
MIKIQEAIVVEGRYDKAALAGLVDTVILDTAGFGIFADREKLALLKRLAQARGLVVLTDSDGGGFLIRNFLKSAIDPALVKHAYIPDVYGKERRKKSPSKEGKLGVEGMAPEVLLDSLRRAGVSLDGNVPVRSEPPLTKAELYALGLTGRPDSAVRRGYVLKALSLPERLTTNAMLDVLNLLVTRQQLQELVAEQKEKEN